MAGSRATRNLTTAVERKTGCSFAMSVAIRTMAKTISSIAATAPSAIGLPDFFGRKPTSENEQSKDNGKWC
jgi:hypothetical protein